MPPRLDGVRPLISVGEPREALGGGRVGSVPGFPGGPGARGAAPTILDVRSGVGAVPVCAR
jgi:hypothetical protein